MRHHGHGILPRPLFKRNIVHFHPDFADRLVDVVIVEGIGFGVVQADRLLI